MTDARPLYLRDPQAYHAMLEEGNRTQARKRVSVDLLIRDEMGRVLLVQPSYKPGWDMPGGMVEANEPLREAGAREVREELGLQVQPGPMLCVAWAAPHGPWDDLLAFVFDGGILAAGQAQQIRLEEDGELDQFEFCPLPAAVSRLDTRTARRLEAAAAALTGLVTYLEGSDSREIG